MVAGGLLDKSVDYKKAYTTKLIDGMKIMMN
jgi:hypothetical protein